MTPEQFQQLVLLHEDDTILLHEHAHKAGLDTPAVTAAISRAAEAMTDLSIAVAAALAAKAAERQPLNPCPSVAATA